MQSLRSKSCDFSATKQSREVKVWVEMLTILPKRKSRNQRERPIKSRARKESDWKEIRLPTLKMRPFQVMAVTRSWVTAEIKLTYPITWRHVFLRWTRCHVMDFEDCRHLTQCECPLPSVGSDSPPPTPSHFLYDVVWCNSDAQFGMGWNGLNTIHWALIYINK